MTQVAGIDFGTASVRVSIIDSDRGKVATGSANYPVLRSANDPDFATQRHEDHCKALQQAFCTALSSGVNGSEIAAIALDTTGSTVVPIDVNLKPLDDYYLWCDHRAWREAAEITARAREQKLAAIDWCGGSYSSEWGFAKVLHWLRTNPTSRRHFYAGVEHCDLMVALLCGFTDASKLPRSICAAGHKWMWNAELGGLPSEDFLCSVDPLLAGVRDRMQGPFLTSQCIAGGLCREWAQRLGLTPGIPVPVGALDAHWDAIGAGCRLEDVVNVIGTSSCIMALSEKPILIPGVAGVVAGSIQPDLVGIEAGLSAAGDLFDAIARRARQPVEELAGAIAGYQAGQTGLVRFAWDNGDRSVLMNPQLRGLCLGWRLNHTAADELFAAIEGVAFHTRIILERMQEYGVPVRQLINAGGIPQRNETLNRVYANIMAKPILVPAGDTTSLGSAIFAFLAAGAFSSVVHALESLAPRYRVVEPDPTQTVRYEDLYQRYKNLYFKLGRGEDCPYAA
jgi:L-ribulokinase